MATVLEVAKDAIKIKDIRQASVLVKFETVVASKAEGTGVMQKMETVKKDTVIGKFKAAKPMESIALTDPSTESVTLPALPALPAALVPPVPPLEDVSTTAGSMTCSNHHGNCETCLETTGCMFLKGQQTCESIGDHWGKQEDQVQSKEECKGSHEDMLALPKAETKTPTILPSQHMTASQKGLTLAPTRAQEKGNDQVSAASMLCMVPAMQLLLVLSFLF